nr:UvrD-like helicase, ATP-binding domain, P-loop containing nucleoside triphosphate hydrolase [Tanacetum cinerariifolium]
MCSDECGYTIISLMHAKLGSLGVVEHHEDKFTKLILSLSLDDILNQDLYKNKVESIPLTFKSDEHYFGSYVNSLVEETRSELTSFMEIVHRAPYADMLSCKESKNGENKVYDVTVVRWKNQYSGRGRDDYNTLLGDLLLLVNGKPKLVSDLKRVGRTCVLAMVKSKEDDRTSMRVKTPQLIEFQDRMLVVFFNECNNKERLEVSTDTEEIHLEHRVKRIVECLRPVTGVRHVILIGNERQLPATVNSNETVSLGPMFDSYYFINVVGGKEEKDDDGRSLRNMVEVAIVIKIVKNLYRGNERTLTNSESIWKDLVFDARNRHCFFDADADECLKMTIIRAKKELEQLDDLVSRNSVLFEHAKWKVTDCIVTKLYHYVVSYIVLHVCSILCYQVLFSALQKIVWKVDSSPLEKQVLNLLLKLSSGRGDSKTHKTTDSIFSAYLDDYLNRCTEKCFERKLGVPRRTGKTTILTMKLLQHEQKFRIASNGIYEAESSRIRDGKVDDSKISKPSVLRQLFINCEIPTTLLEQERALLRFANATNPSKYCQWNTCVVVCKWKVIHCHNQDVIEWHWQTLAVLSLAQGASWGFHTLQKVNPKNTITDVFHLQYLDGFVALGNISMLSLAQGASLNKAMEFISTAFTSRYPPTNNQLRTSSNPWNQQLSMMEELWYKQYREDKIRGQVMVIRWYNCQKEGHMARQCTKPKRPRNSAWFKEKAILAEDLKLGVVLDEEQIVFLADTRDIVTIGQ